MNQEERDKLNRLEESVEEINKKLQSLFDVADIDFIGNLEERLVEGKFKSTEDFDASGISGIADTNPNLLLSNITITIPAGGGTDTYELRHLENPDSFLTVKYKGNIYKVWANKL